MDTHFILTTSSSCKIQIVDQTDYPEQSTINSYSFNDSVSVNILEGYTTKGQNIISKEILDHKELCDKSYTQDSNTYISKDISEFQLSNDGKFIVYHILIPTKEWVDKFDILIYFIMIMELLKNQQMVEKLLKQFQKICYII